MVSPHGPSQSLRRVVAAAPPEMEGRAHAAHAAIIRSNPARRMSKLQIDVAKARSDCASACLPAYAAFAQKCCRLHTLGHPASSITLSAAWLPTCLPYSHPSQLTMLSPATSSSPSPPQTLSSQALRAIGVECLEEHPCPASRMAVDIALVLNGDKYAIEVDGPVHFYANHLNVRDGPTRFRDRLLRAAGWRVVAVPYYEVLPTLPTRAIEKDERCDFLSDASREKRGRTHLLIPTFRLIAPCLD